MIKILIGIFIGIATTAIAQDSDIANSIIANSIKTIPKIVLMAGVNPNNEAAVIKVDKNGYVICSDKSKYE